MKTDQTIAEHEEKSTQTYTNSLQGHERPSSSYE